jgi:protein-tyrosine phosphatase
MIDVHSHILPDIDDGARSIDMALAMAQQAVDIGVTHMVCTPHLHWGTFNNTKELIQPVFDAFQNELLTSNIPLSISWAAEVRLNELVPIWAKKGQLPFLGKLDEKDVVLLELPHSHIPAGTEQLVKWLLANNIQPLIPHPERNRDIWERPEKIKWLRNLGCKFQVTAGAITGRFGEHVQDIALSMLELGLVDLVASDTHDTRRRPNDMKEAFEMVRTLHSEKVSTALFLTTPAKILNKS